MTMVSRAEKKMRQLEQGEVYVSLEKGLLSQTIARSDAAGKKAETKAEAAA
jgi:hypothetical protein|uniref:Uncharacterized protein n=1 Tax=Bionectria ochroleuca TaxID=29856 RepID=A0A8H7KAQ0_BIOOC